MPAKVKVRILAGRNLPVMDKSSDASDAFVEVKLGNITYKTEVYRRSLNPFWNSEWFKFEVSDQELQDEPLQIRIMDYDTYSANDAIGKVYINLNPLVLNPSRWMSGWLPIYDTLHGIRGEINCMVKVNLFADNNPYRHSSCGVRFFFSDIPNGYKCDAILGFVDELLVNDDPEYQWIDKIRTPRASNEARQTLFTKLSGEVQRKLGLKAEVFGGNAVIGYQQSFDLEGGSGIVGRGIGTAVVLSKIGHPYNGIITPPTPGPQRQYPSSNHQYYSNSTLSTQYLDRTIQRQRPHTERHLVHSVSAEKARQQKRQCKIIAEVRGSTCRDQQELSVHEASSSQSQKSLSKSVSDATQTLISSSFSVSTSSGSTTAPSISTSTPSSSQKRRKDKNQTASIDDALSIIEEKRDDDEYHSSTAKQGGNLNATDDNQPSSSSTARQRSMVRSKEIDLNDESVTTFTKPRTFSVSSSEDDDLNDNLDSSATTMSSSTVDAKSPREHSESLLSSSTPSASLLTEETVRAAEVTPDIRSSHKSKSTESPKATYSKMIRSETDLTGATKAGPSVTAGSASIDKSDNKKLAKPATRYPISRSESSYTHPESITKKASIDSKQCNTHSKAEENFIQTVRTIKTEQRLLQNLVRHQNANLNNTSGNRMKGMFIYPNRVHQSEYPFVTLKKFPDAMIKCTGGVVSVHSVKLLDHIINDEESETRDIWWTEIRKEIRSHAKALNCNTILGYSESSKVIEDVCILSAIGTAAILRDPIEDLNSCDQKNDKNSSSTNQQKLKVPYPSTSPPPSHSSMPTSISTSTTKNKILNQSSDPRDSEGTSIQHAHIERGPYSQTKNVSNDNLDADDMKEIDCSFCHTSLNCLDSMSSSSVCEVCKSSKVPDVLLLTIEPPRNLNITTTGTIVQARVCRAKRDSHGETSARELAEALPFLEYELHRQLFSKLKFKGYNCLYNLCVDVSVGENMLTAIATGTGCFVLGLPIPNPPQISACKGIKASKLVEIQRLISICAAKNRERHGLDQVTAQLELYHRKHGIIESFDFNNQESGRPRAMTDEPLVQEVSSSKLMARSTSHIHDSNSDVYASGDNSSARQIGTSRKKSSRHHHQVEKKSRSTKASHFHRDKSKFESDNLVSLVSDENNIVLEVDDNEDADIIALLIDSDIPEGYLVCNSETIPSMDQNSIISMNMFTQVMRSKLVDIDKFAQQFDWIMQSLYVKLRRSIPCCLTNVKFVVDLPESNILQISVTGCLIGLNTLPSKSISDNLVDSAQSSSYQGENKHDLRINSSQIAPELETTSTVSSSTSMSSSSSSSTSASPTSSSTIGSSSTSSTSEKSNKESQKSSSGQTVQQETNPPVSSFIQTKATKQVKSITKKLSNTNIAALLTGGSGKNKQSNNGKEIELVERRPQVSEIAQDTNATIAAVKQEIEQNRLGQRPETTTNGQFFRPVFKKQQTYPGANSPAISGQDRLIPSTSSATTNTNVDQASSLNNATRRATLILNKVKQPLKDFGSSFNASNSTAVTSNVEQTNVTFSSVPSKASSKQGSKNRSSTVEGQQPVHRIKMSNSASVVASSHIHMTSGGQHITNICTGIPSSPSHHIQYMGGTSGEIRSSTSINSSIDITSLSYIPGAKDYHYLGNLSFSFVRETSSVRENGGLNGFIHCFLMEVYAIVRAHVSALGGNAFLSFRLQQSCIFYHSNKNQAQCLISVAGDAVQVAI